MNNPEYEQILSIAEDIANDIHRIANAVAPIAEDEGVYAHLSGSLGGVRGCFGKYP